MLKDYRQLSRNRDFVLAASGRCVSTFGDEIALIALTLRLQESGARPYEIAVLLAAGLLPFVALGRLVGRVVDSYDSRRIVVGASAVQVACCVPLIFVHQAALLAVLVFVLGAGAAFTQATWQALIPRVVGPDGLAPAISLLQSGATAAGIGAAALGGVVSSLAGTGVPLLIDAVTFAAMGVAAMLVRTRRNAAPAAGILSAASARTDAPADRRTGWAVIAADPLLAPLVAGLAVFVLLVMMVNIVQVFLIRETLHAGSAWYGGVEALWMAGVVVGALGSGRIEDDGRRVRAVLLGTALASAALAGFGVAPAVIILGPLSLAGGIGNGMVTSGVSTLMMARSPEHVRGRVAAAVAAILNAASVLSLAAGGALTSVLTPRQVYVLAGALGLVVTVVMAVRVAAAKAASRGTPLRFLD